MKETKKRNLHSPKLKAKVTLKALSDAVEPDVEWALEVALDC